MDWVIGDIINTHGTTGFDPILPDYFEKQYKPLFPAPTPEPEISEGLPLPRPYLPEKTLPGPVPPQPPAPAPAAPQPGPSPSSSLPSAPPAGSVTLNVPVPEAPPIPQTPVMTIEQSLRATNPQSGSAPGKEKERWRLFSK